MCAYMRVLRSSLLWHPDGYHLGVPRGVSHHRLCSKIGIPDYNNLYVRYETARQIKVKQDSYCAKALRGEWKGLGEFPDNLQWEALVDVLRGRVKVTTTKTR